MDAIAIQKQFRYESIQGEGTCNHIIYVLHGYGQLVTYFIRKFQALNLENTVIVAPEGTHRFYLNGKSGRVGASWMTKEWREQDIRENIHALNSLHQQLVDNYGPTRITIVGFSQGGATAARWIAAGQIQPDHFISWASVFPPDLANDVHFEKMNLHFVVGDSDPYFDQESLPSSLVKYTQLGFETVIFKGGHDLELNTLQQLINT
jgi:predicted esterase